MPASFQNVQFPTDISRKATSKARFKTRITTSESGNETRVRVWTYPLREYDIAVDFWDKDRLYRLQSFYIAVAAGDAYSFRFKDWSDYFRGYKYDQVNGLTVDAPNAEIIGTGNGSATNFQLIKTYVTPPSWSATRVITKPVAGSVHIYFNGTEQLSGWTVDTTTGIVTFSTAPTAGVSITAAYQFDVPVRFSGDVMELNLDAIQSGSWGSLKLVEVRE